MWPNTLSASFDKNGDCRDHGRYACGVCSEAMREAGKRQLAEYEGRDPASRIATALERIAAVLENNQTSGGRCPACGADARSDA